MANLADYTALVRSKNAEPFLTTIDLYFKSSEPYEKVKQSGRLTTAAVADIYSIPEEAVYGVYFVDDIHAAKVTLFKYNGDYRGLGDPDLGDIFGAQVYVPLLSLEID
jgi:hypothetical protein